ncbi:NAD(P)-binding protein [Paraburkholderia sp. CNPSo 3155]|uniref:FAD-dependent monooxygenase n=1 Tax=Paraburkholderia atlantica TaxID=2654982 RepID=UPI00128B8B84|nr:FAD-dependent monooxygenase [Paraburkholderia atlantica]MPW11161.1 NAD(P)-binding protein [Paraburkholderia atlantica]
MSKTKILIAGGGIGGMSAAIALLQRGFDVEVFEQAPEVREFGAGIQTSPNGNRALNSLGVFENLHRLANPSDAKEIRLWNTGKTWPLFNLGDAAVRKYGFPYMTVFRPDLLRVLADEVKRLKPDAVYTGARCEDVEQTDDGKVHLKLADGRVFTGDILVGADGVHSKVRQALFGPAETLFTGMIAWRTLIPMEKLPEKFRRSVAVNWVGPGGHVVHYPIQGGSLLNWVGTLEGCQWDNPSSWTAPADIEECRAAFAGWNEEIEEALSYAPSVTKWALCGKPQLEGWVKGRATLLGDACHVTLPFLAQGAVHSIEDGVVLARCLEKYSDPETALQRFDAVRRPRTYAMVQGSSDNTSRFHNPALATVETAEEFISREWQSNAIGERYDWLFTYDVDTIPV